MLTCCPIGAGLLLNNLSVFRGCEIMFDSQDVPDAVPEGGHVHEQDVQVLAQQDHQDLK